MALDHHVHCYKSYQTTTYDNKFSYPPRCYKGEVPLQAKEEKQEIEIPSVRITRGMVTPKKEYCFYASEGKTKEHETNLTGNVASGRCWMVPPICFVMMPNCSMMQDANNLQLFRNLTKSTGTRSRSAVPFFYPNYKCLVQLANSGRIPQDKVRPLFDSRNTHFI
ncbi:hypothetical protein Gotur_032261 [Gossypium turneri]